VGRSDTSRRERAVEQQLVPRVRNGVGRPGGQARVGEGASQVADQLQEHRVVMKQMVPSMVGVPADPDVERQPRVIGSEPGHRQDVGQDHPEGDGRRDLPAMPDDPQMGEVIHALTRG
jgi:hypothetical protein